MLTCVPIDAEIMVNVSMVDLVFLTATVVLVTMAVIVHMRVYTPH